jgi:hypothetical protein
MLASFPDKLSSQHIERRTQKSFRVSRDSAQDSGCEGAISFAWSNRADIAPPLAPDRGHPCLYPKDVERPPHRITMLARHQRRFKKAAPGDAQPDSDYDIAVFSTSSRKRALLCCSKWQEPA